VWKKHPARSELLALYREVDTLLAGITCPSSGDCCHFARTGREPYPHAVELAEVEHAARATPPPRSLPVAERRCPMLDVGGRCRIYASRPFGCRTYFCDRATGAEYPRDEVRAIGRRIADLSARTFPRDPGPRPLTRAVVR
jgi:hypothetical protein